MIRALTMAAAVMLLLTPAADARPKKQRIVQAEGISFLSHPAGCPGRAFCGCGACVHIFGISAAECRAKGLWKASAWPRHYKGASQVAVWRSHVAVVGHWTGPTTAMMYDYNSGGHKSRYWERDTRGAKIVGGSLASN